MSFYLYGQLPFPMECLYADPDREVIPSILLGKSVKFPRCVIIASDSSYLRRMMSWACTMVLAGHFSTQQV